MSNLWSRFLYFCLIFLPLFVHGQEGNQLIQKADSLYFLPYPAETDDRMAMEIYSKILDEVPEPAVIDDFIRAAEHLGNLQVIYGQQAEAAISYRKALFFARAFQQPDTLVYDINLFLGEVLFRMSRLDSAIFHLKEAERIQSEISLEVSPERLFNALGVYYFETGNYLQSIRYFTQAESYLDAASGDYVQFARYSFLSNKASALYHLEQYDSARRIYSQLLEWNINSDQVRINLANTFLKENRAEEALQTLSQVGDVKGRNFLSFLNLQTKGYLIQNDLTRSDSLLQLTESAFDSLLISSKDYQRGIYLSNYGNFKRKKNSFQEAIKYYHLSVVELHPSFNSDDIFENPKELSLGMGAVTLFESLVSKAEISWDYFKKSQNNEYLELGWDSYESAFELAEFISANFDNDEARIFLGDRALKAYQLAIGQLIDFYQTQQKDSIKNQVFLWAEQSKSTALRLGVLESKKRKNSGIPSTLLDEEQAVLQQLARNYRDQYENPDESRLEALNSEYTDLQVRLSRLRDEIKTFSKNEENTASLSIKAIQSRLPQGVLLISFFEGTDYLTLFLLNNESLEWQVLDWDREDHYQVLEWKDQIRSWRTGMSYQSPLIISQLSNLFFEEWKSVISDASLLMIVPHGVFSGVSFDEFLVDGQMLIEKLPISYQFSALNIQKKDLSTWDQSEMVSFAPFDQKTGPEGLELPALPGSSEEIQDLPGLKLQGPRASLENFLKMANQKRIIHLATHAVASDEDREASFVAFYPDGDFRLFENELKFQAFDQVELVFLSACETASGKFSESEGLVSLARAFSFAGADNLVSTLWLTEDRVATYMSKEFYKGLGEGLTYAEALRAAKLTLLHDPKMAQFRDAPYWTNLIFVGEIQEKSYWDFFLQFFLVGAFALILIGLIYWFLILRFK